MAKGRPRKRPSASDKSDSLAGARVVGVQLTEGQISHLEKAAELSGVSRNELMRVATPERIAQVKNMANIELTKPSIGFVAHSKGKVK